MSLLKLLSEMRTKMERTHVRCYFLNVLPGGVGRFTRQLPGSLAELVGWVLSCLIPSKT